MVTHHVAILAIYMTLMKCGGISVELLTPPHEMEFEAAAAIRPHEAPEFEEHETEEEEQEVLRPKREDEEA